MTLNLRNAAQVAMFELELTSQLSDGFWKNITPHNHHKVWCEAEVVADPENVGRDFYAIRTSYNFTNGDLLKVIGNKLVTIANMAANGAPLDIIRESSGWKLKDMYRYAQMDNEGDYWNAKIKRILDYFKTEEAFEDSKTGAHNFITMRRELKDIGDIIKIRRHTM